MTKTLVKEKGNRKFVQYKCYLQNENERKQNLICKTNELWKKKMFSLPDKQIPILIWILVHQAVFAYSQPSK